MRRCSRCGLLKPEADFAFAKKATGRRQAYCRACQAEYRRQHYLSHRDAYITLESTRIKNFRIENRVKMFAYLSTHPCVDCGETDVIVLEFDHRDPISKRREVTFLAARKPWKFVLAEIDKCDVRCANCHRRRTAAQFRWAKAALSPNKDGRAGSASDQELPPPPTGIRTCTKCGEVKPSIEFSLKNKKTGRRATICRACVRLNSRRHYLANRPTYLAKAHASGRRYRRGTAIRIIEFLSGKACIDCGEADPLVLEFDHRDGVKKEANVSRLVAAGAWARVAAEIAKCDIRCANCHKKRTAAQFSWTRRALQLMRADSTQERRISETRTSLV